MAAPSECHASQDEGDKKVPPKILPCEDINDWDPMEDAFNDPNFNQYTHGPAKYTPESKVQASCPRRLGPGLENYSEVYRVFISKPPSDLDEDGIFLLASRVSARPINVYKKREGLSDGKPSWAIVEFAKHSDARKMIEGLHKVPPMNLDVQFGFSDEEKARHARERNEKRRFEEEEAGRKIREPVNEMLSTIPDAQPVGMEKFPGDENRDKVLKVGGRGLPLNPPCRLTSWPQEPRAGGLSQHAAATVNLNELLDPLHQSSELDYFGQYAGGYNDDATAVISKAVDKLQRDYHPVNSRSRNFGGRGYYMPNRASERKPGGLRHSAGRAYNPVQHMGLSNPKNEAPWERTKKLEFVGPDGGTGQCGECHRNTNLRCVRCNAWFCSEACLDVAGMHPYKCEVCDLVDPYWKANFVSRGAGSENRSAPQQQQQQANGHQDQPPGPEYIEPNYGAGRGLPKQPESVLNPNSANFKPSSSSQTLVDSSLPRVKQFPSKPSFMAHKSQVANPPETSTKAIPEPTLPKPESNKLEEAPETKSTETVVVPDTTVKPGIIKTHSQNPKPSFNKKGDIPQQKGGKNKGNHRSRSKGHSTPSPKNNSRTNTPEPRSKGVNSNNLIACSNDGQEEAGKSEQKSFTEACSPAVRGVNSHNLITCSESSPESDSQLPTPARSTTESPSNLSQCDKKPEMPPWPNVPTVTFRLPNKASRNTQSDQRPKESSAQSKPIDPVQQVESQQPEVQTEAKNQPTEQSQPVKAVSEQSKTPRHVSPNPAKAPAATKPVPVQNTPVQDQSSVVDKQQQTDKPSQSANTTTVPVQTSQAKSVQDPPPESKHAAAKQGNTSAQKSQPSSQLKQTEAPQSEQKGLHQATPKQVNTAKSQPSSPKPPGKTFASSLKNQTTPPLNFYRMHPGPHNTVPFKPSLPNPNKSWASTLKSQPESTSPQAKANSGNLEPSNFPPPQQQQQSPQTPPSRDQPDFSIPPPNMSPKPATPTQNIPPYPHAISPNNVARANPMPQHNIVQNSMVQSNNVQNQVSPGSVSQNPMAQRNALQHSIAQHSSVQGPVAQDSPVQNPMAQRNSMQGPMAQQNTMKYPVVQSNPVQNPVAQQNMIQNPMAQNSVQNSVAHNNPMQKQMGSGNVTFNPMMPSHAPYNQIGPGNIAQNQMVPGNIAQNQMMPGNIAQNQMMPGNAMHNHMGRGNLMHGHMAPASNIVHGQMGPGNNMSAVNLMPNQMGPGNFAQNYIGQGNPLHSNIHPGNPVHSQMGPGNVPHNHMNPMQQHMAQQAVAAHHNMQQQVPNYTAQTAPYRSPSVSPHKPTVAMHPRGCQQQMNFPRNPAAQTQEKIPNIPPFPAQFQNPDYYTQRRSKGPRYPQQQRTNWRNNYQNKQWPSKPHRYDRNPTPPFNAESTSASQQQNRLAESAPAPVMESNTPVAQTSSTTSKDQSKPPTPVPQTSHTTSPPAPVITNPIAATDTAPSSAARDSAPPIADSANPPAMTSSQPPSKTVESQEPVLPEKEVEATVKVPEAKTEETKDDLSIRRLLESIATSNPKASSSETPDIPEVSSVEASMVAKQLREEETELACESVQGNSPDKIKTPEISSPDACKPLQSAAIQNPEAPKCVEDETTTCVQDTEETDEDGSVPESSENQAAAARDTQETATSSEQNKVRVKAATENTGDTKSYEKPPRHQNPPSNQQHRHRQTRQRSYAYPEQQQQQQQMYPHMCLIPVTQPQQPPVVYSPEYNTFVVMSPVPQEQEYPSASGTPDYDGSNFYPVEEYYESPVQYYYPQASQEQEYYASESEASSTDQYVPANAPQYSTITSPPMYYPSPSPEVGNEYSDQESEGAVYMEPVYQMQYPNQQVVYVAPSYAPKEPEQQYVQYPAQVMYQPGYPPQQMVPMVPQYYNTVYQQPMMIPGPMPPPSPSPQAYAPQMPSPQPYVPQMPSSQAFVPHQIHPPQAFAPQMQAQQSYVPQNPPAFVPAAVQPQYRILPRPSGAGIVLPPHLVSDKQMQ